MASAGEICGAGVFDAITVVGVWLMGTVDAVCEASV